MDTIAAKKRDFAVKAKKLRREGLVTGFRQGAEGEPFPYLRGKGHRKTFHKESCWLSGEDFR